ncbi:MAG: RNA polymerase sigma factor [Elusimicrobia bacterium]|nr:RNA polymerase sigma factor [Elusimicrobiota bacterium]
METDEALVRRARAGDAEAFGVLVSRHQKAVAGFLLSVLHDLDAAQDAAQQAFVRAFMRLESFEERSSFKTWVSRIALNVARSRLRWARMSNWLSLDAPRDSEGGTWEESVRRAGPREDETRVLEKKLDLERALAALSPREREVAAMRLEGYSLDEVAGVLGISEGTVKSTLFAATRKMRQRLL